jgi:hypothetical protein
MMRVATPFLPINMDGYGLTYHQINGLTRPFCLNQASIFFQEIWTEIGLLEIMIQACSRCVIGVPERRPIPKKNMDASYKAIGRSIIKQVCILFHRHPYFSRYTGLGGQDD